MTVLLVRRLGTHEPHLTRVYPCNVNASEYCNAASDKG